MQAFIELADSELPIYARPVVLRIQRSVATTGTQQTLGRTWARLI